MENIKHNAAIIYQYAYSYPVEFRHNAVNFNMISNAAFQRRMRNINLNKKIGTQFLYGVSFVSILENKAHLRDLKAATGQVILFKFDPNHQ